MSGLGDEVSNISRHFSSALLRNPSVVRNALRECGGADGTYKLLDLVEYLLKFPSVKESLEEITCHVQLSDDDNDDDDGSLVVPEEPYGAKMVHLMLSKEKYFMSFQHSYYLLYQSFIPATVHIILQRYTIPKSLETRILKQFNWRTVNQSLLNYLLIELRRDKNDAKFWETLTMIIEEPRLKGVVNNYASLERSEHKDVREISSDNENFTCLSEAALPAISFPGATDHSIPMWMYSVLKTKRCRQLTLHRSISEGSPLDQRKLEMSTENNRPFDKRSLSYHEMADVCLKTVGTEKKLFNASPGKSTVDLCPQCGEMSHDEMPCFFLRYRELAKVKPNIFAVLKKYSNVLLDNFPENYMTSLEIMCHNSPTTVPSDVIEAITTPTSYIVVNERIFDFLLNKILTSKSQMITIDYVVILKKIVKDFNKNAVLKKFDNELTYAIAQDTNATSLHHGSSSSVKTTQVNYSDFRGGQDHSHQWVDNTLYQSTPTTPVQRIDEMSDIIFSEPSGLDKLKPKTFAVIKKYYIVLLKNFPKDHMVALERYSSIHKLSDDTVDFIISADNPDQANRRLFGYMTCVISPDHDDSLFTFCSNLEVVIGNREMLNVIEQLRNDLIEAIFEDVNNSGELTSHGMESHQSLPQQTSLPSRQSSSSSQLHSPHHSLSSHHQLVSQQPLSPQQQQLSDEFVASLDPNDINFNLGFEFMTSLPVDFKRTVECIRQHFSSDEINHILSAPDYLTANRRIMTILMSRVKCIEDFLKLCDILESIENAPHMSAVVRLIKKRVLYGQGYAGVTANTPDGIPDSTHRLDKDKFMPAFQTEQQREKVIAVMNKHYSAILKSFPVDFSISESQMLSHSQRSASKINSRISNEIIFNQLVNDVVSPDNEKTPVDLCRMLLMLIGDTPAIRELQKDVLELLDRESADRAIASFQIILSQRNSIMKVTNLSMENDQDDQKEQEICLSCFDDYYDLLLKVNPRFARVKFIVAFSFVHGDPLTGNLLFQHNEIQMEVLLVNVRSSIGIDGIDCFLKLLDILCNQEPYKEIGFHMLDDYYSKGGCQIPTDCYTRTGNPLPIEELTRRLEYHSKQLQAGLQYQPAKPLPEYYIPRPNLLNRMVKAVMDSDSGSIDVDLALFALPGYGKSTLVKALCYQDDIVQYFLDGFLWIKFSYGNINHYSQLKKIYYQLTAMNFTGDQSLLIDKLKSLVANHLQRLLVIINDVYRPDDVMLYLEIFRNCKVILLSTKEELCHFIPIKQKIVLAWRNTDPVMSIKLVTAQVKGFENINSELFAQLKGLVEDLFNWPILLHIVHHQLLLYCNKYNLSPSSALQKIIQKILPTKKSIMNCAERIVESSLEFLENKDICCLNELLYGGGLEYITPKCLLPNIWKVSEEAANKCMELLHSCGFVQYTEKLQLTETTYSLIPCVEMHSTVIQYLLIKMNKTTLAYDV